MPTKDFSIPPTPVSTRIGFLSDLHVEGDARLAHFQAGLDTLVEAGADVVVVAGDLVEHPDDEPRLAQVHEALEGCALPYLVVSGNHDVRVPGEDDVFRRYFGVLPRVQRSCGITWLLFDSFGALGVEERDEAEHETFAARGHYGDGRIGEEQFARMASMLPEDGNPRFAIVHHHLDEEPDTKVRPLLDADAFHQWCEAHDVRLVFVGHLHRTAPPSSRGSVTRLRVGKSTRAPYPVAIVAPETGIYTLLTRPESTVVAPDCGTLG